MKLFGLTGLLIASFLSFGVKAQTQVLPDHDIVVFRLESANGALSLAKPELVATGVGYDNQPAFSRDGNKIYFTRIENNNADIWVWQRAQPGREKSSARKLVASELSEYSPTLIDGQENSLSTVRVEKDGSQRLWRYDFEGGFSPIFEEIKPVGYHVWSGDRVALFVLGEPHQLRVARLGEPQSRLIDQNIGRCLQKIPASSRISYTQIVSRSNEPEKPGSGEGSLQRHQLKSYDFESGSIISYGQLPEGTQDYAWLDQNTVISSTGSDLLVAKLGKVMSWQKIKNPTGFKLNLISRLAISKDKKQLAVVFIKPTDQSD